MYEPGFEPGTIDVSYSRWLMVHLHRPVDAMRAIHTILKPGGVMVCEEADVSAVYTEPASAAYDEMRDIALAAGRARGVDYSSGRRIHTRALAAGFDEEEIALRVRQAAGFLFTDCARRACLPPQTRARELDDLVPPSA